MKKILPFMLSSLLLWWCNLLPSSLSDDHGHTSEELTNPNHHNDGIESWHTMDHAAMVTDELSFISEMIPHHQEAIDTSASLLTKTQNNDLKNILINIMSGQNQEIIMMKKRLADFYTGSEYKPMYMPMMRDTSTISSITTIEKIYMEDMIKHHQWAIDMAKKILSIMSEQDPLIKLTEASMKHRNDVKTFAQAIIDAQSNEIIAFQTLLEKY